MADTTTNRSSANGQPLEVEEMPLGQPIPEIPRSLMVRSVTRELVTLRTATELPDTRSCAHVCLWAPTDVHTRFGDYKAAVMMHLRFDGTFGFPGGLVDPGEDILEALNRELEEEINYSEVRQRRITYKDYHSSRVVKDKAMALHFFVAELTLPQFENLECSAVTAKDYGKEVFGTVRVPLFTMGNSYNGLPAFINNRFIGSAKQELLMALFTTGLFTNDEIDLLVYNANNKKLASTRM